MLAVNGPIIWLVEDDIGTQRLLTALLKQNGFRPMIFDTAEKAYAALQSQPTPALIILDMLLPGMSGVDLIRLIKQNQVWEKIPVVVVTVLSRAEADLSGDTPAAYWLNKPFDAAHLMETINHILSTAKMERVPNNG